MFLSLQKVWRKLENLHKVLLTLKFLLRKLLHLLFQELLILQKLYQKQQDYLLNIVRNYYLWIWVPTWENPPAPIRMMLGIICSIPMSEFLMVVLLMNGLNPTLITLIKTCLMALTIILFTSLMVVIFSLLKLISNWETISIMTIFG